MAEGDTASDAGFDLDDDDDFGSDGTSSNLPMSINAPIGKYTEVAIVDLSRRVSCHCIVLILIPVDLALSVLFL